MEVIAVAPHQLKATVTRDAPWWTIRFDGEAIYSQASMLRKVRATALEAAALHFDCEPEDIDLTLEIKLPAEIDAQWQKSRDLEKESRVAAREAARLARQSVADLASDGLSATDIAELLGLSRQRVSQLLHSA